MATLMETTTYLYNTAQTIFRTIKISTSVDPLANAESFNAHFLRLLNAVNQESTIPLNLDIGLDVAKDDSTAQAILHGIATLIDRVRTAEKLADPHSVTDTPMASIPCPTCGQFPSALTAPPTILEHAHAPPPDLPTFDNEHDELVYLRDAVQSLREQADEFHLLKSQVPDVARVCDAVARGDLSQKITVPVHGAIMVQIKDVVNTMVDKLSQFAKEGTRISQKVGMEQHSFSISQGHGANSWTSSINSLQAINLGDLSRQVNIDAREEILDSKNTVNGMHQSISLRAPTSEVTHVTLEVSSEGKLGGQAYVPEGVWLELVRTPSLLLSRIKCFKRVNRMSFSFT
ncbi:Hybrid signal transduction histidine kinase J [Termitomyces sp. J132]|nr:Hybrid signal transduction histidine kinase J [Termitomyces sp. J132]